MTPASTGQSSTRGRGRTRRRKLGERKALTDAICANLRLSHADMLDLEQLERRLASIASAIAVIRADDIVKELDAEK